MSFTTCVLRLAMLLTASATIGADLYPTYAYRSRPEAIEPATQTPGSLKLEQLTTDGKIRAAAISPDGKRLAYVEENNGQQGLWLKQTATSVNVRLIFPAYAVYDAVAFSHKGDYIYFVRHQANESSDLYRIPVRGGPPAKLIENVEGGFSLAADDNRLAFQRRDRIAREDTLYLADLINKRERVLIKHQAPDWLFAFAWSPDGKTIVFATGETDSMRRTMTISEVKVETGQEKLLMKPNWYLIRQIEWLPDGKGLLICARENLSADIWQLSYPGLKLQNLTDDLNDYLSISLTEDAGRILAVQSKLVSQVWVSPRLDTRFARKIVDGRGRPAWMADGRIVYSSGSGAGSDIWIAKADGSEAKQLTDKSRVNNWPAISLAGRSIVFQSDRTGAQYLWRMNWEGTNQKQLTSGYGDRNPAFSPDGRWVYYNSSTDFSLWKIPTDGGPRLKVTDEYNAYPSVSPDGKLIASFRFPRFGHEATITIWSVNELKTVAELKLAEGFWISRTIQWETDNSAVIYAIKDEDRVKLYRHPLNQQPPRLLTSLKAEDEFEFAISNRKQLAFTSTRWDHDIVIGTHASGVH